MKVCEKEKLFPFSTTGMNVLLDTYEKTQNPMILDYFEQVIRIMEDYKPCRKRFIPCRECGFCIAPAGAECEYEALVNSLKVVLKNLKRE